MSYLAQSIFAGYPIQFLIQLHSQKYLLVCTYSTLTPLMYICSEWGLGLLEVHHHLFHFGAVMVKVIGVTLSSKVLNQFPALILLLSANLLYMVGLEVVIKDLCAPVLLNQRVKLAVSWSHILSPLLSPSVFVKRAEAGWY